MGKISILLEDFIIDEDVLNVLELEDRLGYYDIDVDYKLVDIGIGEYEFWGEIGTHKELAIEINKIECDDKDIQYWIDNNYNYCVRYFEDNIEG